MYLSTGASSVGTANITDDSILNADINSAAAIVDTKLATISTAGKVSGAALTSLTSVPAGAGVLPTANLPTIASVPTGALLPYAGSSAPTGYLMADGSVVSQATYAALYAIIAHTYAADPGGGNFTLPDLRARVAGGYKSGDTNFGTLGTAVGAATVTLDTTMIPAHTHTIGMVNGSAGSNPTAVGNSSGATTNPATSSTGGGLAHANIQPTLTVNHIIKT